MRTRVKIGPLQQAVRLLRGPSLLVRDDHALDLVTRYEAIDPSKLHGWLSGLIPRLPGTVLDVGAGSGRDAAWFASQGHDVVAVEPSGDALRRPTIAH